MCGIAGFFHPEQNYENERAKWISVLERMNKAQTHRGPDGSGTFLCPSCGFAHVRLKIIDLLTGEQPIVKRKDGFEFAIVFNGEIYNMNALKESLLKKGAVFETASDTEVILNGYLYEGIEFVKKLNGIFAAAIWDSHAAKLHLFRDRLGVKPLFYTKHEDTFIFSSEIKGLFAYPGVSPVLDKHGLCEIFALGPAKSYGKGVFQNVFEVLPGHIITLDSYSYTDHAYWKLESHPHNDSYERTIDTVSQLVQDSIRRQMVSDVPICTFLSGGVDSSLVSAVCAAELKKQGKQLATFSFDFVDNQKNFKANAFQPSQDRPYVEKMAAYLESDHHFLECDNASQIEMLCDSVKAHDLPAMADVDSSMLYFCSQVSKTHKVTLTGECADEIFGGYPWFHREECFQAQTFPWTMDLSPRKELLADDFIEYLRMDEYVRERYQRSIAETPRCEDDGPEEARRREISWLNLKWFMQTLLNRMDRTSMYSGLEARVPFADVRIVQYVWNVPWEMKAKDGVVKNLLRQSGKGLLPEEVLFRRKSPYPKTYDPQYENLLKGKIRKLLEDGNAPVLQFLDKAKVKAFLEKPSDYGRPWYGQLMAGPQLLAYLIQINAWMEQYEIKVR